MTDEERKVMQMALDALSPDPYRSEWLVAIDMDKAIVAIQKCLANEALEKMAENARELGLDYEPAQEPVAWQVMVEDEAMKEFSIKDMAHDWCVQQKLSGSSYIYWIRPLYTTPPQRTWVGLTDEEIKSIWLSEKDYGDDWLDVQGIARAIEAKLKEKNT